MMDLYLTLSDDTEITHSEMKPDGKVKVYFETPDLKDGFHNAVCWLPENKWEEVQGYTDEEICLFKSMISNNAHAIMDLAQNHSIFET